MRMPSSSTFVALVLALGTAGSLLVSLVLQAQWPTGRWHHAPLHSTMEAVGGLVSIAMAAVLLVAREETADNRFQSIAAGFLGMGILEVFHAVTEPGDGFVFLRNLASLIGAAGFMFVWREMGQRDQTGRWLVWGLTCTAFILGVWVLAFPERVPSMIRDGRFTPIAVAPQSLACLFFFGATAGLFRDYRRSPRPEYFLFASLALMFGLAELVFMYSVPWDARWWFWHGLRLAAYLLVLWEIARRYVVMTMELRTSLEQASRSKDALSQTLEERERMAENLHDSVIQSIYSVTLGLERCQRLVTDRANEVMAPLTTAIADLKAVIRELRGYLVGLEPPLANGRELEAALASLVRSMTGQTEAAYRLNVDPLVVDQISSEHASHFLAVAREAMSNSLRHADAKHAGIELRLEAGYLRLVVEDDGSGFQAPAADASGHGLRNMAARARRLNGQLTIVSQPGHGTRVVFDLPKEMLHAQTRQDAHPTAAGG
jgi:signal transduction histidine kinase